MTLIMETNKKMVPLDGAKPAVPMHPGSILGEELKSRGLRQKDFANSVGMQPSHLSALIHGARNFTPEIASRIESGLKGISASFWIKLQAQYNLDKQSGHLDTRHLVDGYFPQHGYQPLTLRDDGAFAASGGMSQVTLTLPDSDRSILEILCQRMGWQLD